METVTAAQVRKVLGIRLALEVKGQRGPKSKGQPGGTVWRTIRGTPVLVNAKTGVPVGGSSGARSIRDRSGSAPDVDQEAARFRRERSVSMDDRAKAAIRRDLLGKGGLNQRPSKITRSKPNASEVKKIKSDRKVMAAIKAAKGTKSREKREQLAALLTRKVSPAIASGMAFRIVDRGQSV